MKSFSHYLHCLDPYLSIWLTPTKTLRRFFDKSVKQPLFFLPILIMGASFSLDQTTEIEGILGSNDSIWVAFSVLPIGFGASFLIYAFALPRLTRLFGQLWNGQATRRQMTNAYALSLIPYSIVLLYQIVLFLAGAEPISHQLNPGIDAILRLWSFSLLMISISKIQGFSYGYALVNIALTYIPFSIFEMLLKK